MRSSVLDTRLLVGTMRLGQVASDEDAVALVRYFTSLADLVDNVLFGAMLGFDNLTQQEFSTLARSSYEEGLRSKVETQLRWLSPRPFGGTIWAITERAESTAREIRAAAERFRSDQGLEFLVAVKPGTQELVGHLLLAAELVGSR